MGRTDRLPPEALEALARLRHLPGWNQLWYGENGLLAPRQAPATHDEPATDERQRATTEQARQTAGA